MPGNVKILGYEPAAILYSVNAVVALLVAWGLDLNATQVGAISTIATGVLTIATAFMTRPFVVSTIAAAAGTFLTAFAAFGLNLTADEISTSVMVGSIALAYLLRINVTPTAKLPTPARM